MSELQPFSFVHSSRRVIYGIDCLEQLKDIAAEAGARSAALLLDGFFVVGPVKERMRRILAPAVGEKITVHTIAAGEPDTEMVSTCHAELAASAPDLIVAVGGGSLLDAVKVARMLLANPGPVENLAGPGKIMAPHRSLLVAVPTTAGTGSEISESAIISQHGSDIKLIYRSQEMTPAIALLDPVLSVSAPARVTAESGYDAVTHAVEAYVSKAASPMTDPFALDALTRLVRWLPIAFREPQNLTARSQCLIASCQAAIAFNSANLGLAHSIAAPLGALFHVGHGLGNALALPAVTAFNEPFLGEKGATIAALLSSVTPSAGLAKLRAELDLDMGLDAIVKDAAGREELAKSAMKSGQVHMNPRLAKLDDMRRIIDAMRSPIGSQRPSLRD